MRRAFLILAPVLALYLDSIVFARLNLMGIRPDALLAVVASYGVLAGSLYGAGIGLGVGLFADIFFNRFVGLGAAMYFLTGLGAGFFYRKFYADNLIIPAAVAGVAAVLKEFVMAVAVLFSGVEIRFFVMLGEYVLPCALMSSGLCLLIHWISKPVLSGQLSRKMDRGVSER